MVKGGTGMSALIKDYKSDKVSKLPAVPEGVSPFAKSQKTQSLAFI